MEATLSKKYAPPLINKNVFTLHRIILPAQCLELCKLKGDYHHTDEEGHGYAASKQLYLSEEAKQIEKVVNNIHLDGFSAISVDPMMKVYRLAAPNGAVPMHVDDDYLNDNGLLAKYSIIIYLNEGYIGGDTRFHGTNYRFPDKKTGSGLMFKHDVLHEGLPVTKGVKFVLKTDLFVR